MFLYFKALFALVLSYVVLGWLGPFLISYDDTSLVALGLGLVALLPVGLFLIFKKDISKWV